MNNRGTDAWVGQDKHDNMFDSADSGVQQQRHTSNFVKTEMSLNQENETMRLTIWKDSHYFNYILLLRRQERSIMPTRKIR